MDCDPVYKGKKTFLSLFIILMLLLWLPLTATAAMYKVAKGCRIYTSVGKGSKVFATLKKGDTVTVEAVKGKWAQVKKSGKTGYVQKVFLKKTRQKVASKKSAAGTRRSSMRSIQNRLNQKGYLDASAVTGKNNASTMKALRIFQMMNGLRATGKANSITVRKLMSPSAKKRGRVNYDSWSKCGISRHLKDGSCATVVDMATGRRFAIRRVGGSEHLDVEPKRASDTAILKKLYGGNWSWDSRAILLIAGGRYYAAAMNSMPHGAQISRSNNYPGHLCIHLKDSRTHGTNLTNPEHQANIRKVIQYFT